MIFISPYLSSSSLIIRLEIKTLFNLAKLPMRLLNLSPPENVLEEVFSQVMFSNVVTRNERNQIRNVLLTGSLSEDEYAIINRLLYNVRRGWLKIVD